MKFNTVLISVLGLLFALSAYAKDVKKTLFKDLPDVVQRTVLKHMEKKNIINIEKEIDEGAIKYEIETVQNGFSKNINISKNGELLEIEEEVSFSKLPGKAQDAINKAYHGITIKKVEAVQEYYFEIDGDVGGNTLKLNLLATGDIEDQGTEIDNDNEK